MPKTKTEIAIGLFKSGELKDSLRIFKSFSHGFSKEERRVLQIAYECHTGKRAFYEDLGIEVEKMIETAKEIISSRFL